MAQQNKNILAIGGSAGSGDVLRTILGGLSPDLPASIFVTTHIPAHSTGILAENLKSGSALPVLLAIDGQPVESGRVYVAPPDRHLLVIGDTIQLGAGPRENMVRPAIDPMFRSVALSYGPRAVGVVLSGMLDDGASGLHAIKSCGGATVVQHPLDATANEMPLAALEATEVDHVVHRKDLARTLTEIAGSVATGDHHPSDSLRLEVEIAAGHRLGSSDLLKIADPSPLSCPHCQGVLSEIRDARPLRFRCQIGHGYTAETLAAHTVGHVDEAIRVAMRVMEERVTLLERMARDARNTGRTAVAELYDTRLEEYRRYAETLRDAAISSLRWPGPPRSGL